MVARQRQEELMRLGLAVPIARPLDVDPPGAMPVQGNRTTMNLNNILFTNINDSSYFKDTCSALETMEETVDEIVRNVDHLQPFLPGPTNSPSTAFCLLYRLFCFRLTESQMVFVINHDNAYVRCIGFLYLRYCAPFEQLWEWFKDHIDDPTPVRTKFVGRGSLNSPVGQMLRSMLKEMNFGETRLPRIAVLTDQKIRANLDRLPYDPRRWESYAGVDDAAAAQAVAAPASVDRPADRSPRRSPSPRRRTRSPRRHTRSRSPARRRSRSRSPGRSRHRSRSRSPARRRSRSRSPARRRSRSRSPPAAAAATAAASRRRSRSRSPSRHRHSSHGSSSRRHHRSRSRSPSRAK